MRIACVTVFALAGCMIPAQQPSYYPQGAPPPPGGPPGAPPVAQGAPPVAGESCQETLACYGQCNPLTDACVGACDQRTTPDSAQNAHALLQCMAQSGCRDQSCIAQQCGAQITTCTGLTMQTAQAGPAPAAPAAPAGDQVMQPQYDSYHSFIMPPPARLITQADLVGEWDSGAGTGTAYYDSGGNYRGASTINTATHWVIDAQGNFHEQFRGATTTAGAALAQGMSEESAGTFVVENNNTVQIVRQANHYHKDPFTEYYMIVGWFFGQSEIDVSLQGPFNAPPTQQDFADAKRNSYRNEIIHRAR